MYYATNGIEDFCESVARVVALFVSGMTIDEPGGAIWI